MCTQTPSAEVALPLDPRAASVARAFLRDAACATHHARVLDDAQLLVSELVGNGVRHGGPPILLRVECVETDGLQVSVTDGGPGEPQRREAGPDAENGRGLTLVDYISDAWGVEAGEHGKTTWFRLAG
ncbi:hypothetical protein GCM10027446_34360 [Angustibacter peucedani]